jgi:UDP-2,3-diacylglucosamine pyrophosphatase LpxH
VSHYRSIFISDLHLGTRGCNSDALYEFLSENSSDYLFLIGDIIDGWSLSCEFYWPELHQRIVNLVVHKAGRTKVVYVSGNHDEFLRKMTGPFSFTNIHICHEYVHKLSGGQELLLIHGDQFDKIIKKMNWLSHVGDRLYSGLLHAHHATTKIRTRLGLPHWSLARYLKEKTKNIVKFVSNFEDDLVKECKLRKLDGVVCGHIHHADIIDKDGVTYYNDGDFVESCTALVEDFHGNMKILQCYEFPYTVLKEKSYAISTI